jgi:hypothetical protein
MWTAITIVSTWQNNCMNQVKLGVIIESVVFSCIQRNVMQSTTLLEHTATYDTKYHTLRVY